MFAGKAHQAAGHRQGEAGMFGKVENKQTERAGTGKVLQCAGRIEWIGKQYKGEEGKIDSVYLKVRRKGGMRRGRYPRTEFAGVLCFRNQVRDKGKLSTSRYLYQATGNSVIVEVR
jgi:hypothetical protein